VPALTTTPWREVFARNLSTGGHIRTVRDPLHQELLCLLRVFLIGSHYCNFALDVSVGQFHYKWEIFAVLTSRVLFLAFVMGVSWLLNRYYLAPRYYLVLLVFFTACFIFSWHFELVHNDHQLSEDDSCGTFGDSAQQSTLWYAAMATAWANLDFHLTHIIMCASRLSTVLFKNATLQLQQHSH
jgi:hypothetical protein